MSFLMLISHKRFIILIRLISLLRLIMNHKAHKFLKAHKES